MVCMLDGQGFCSQATGDLLVSWLTTGSEQAAGGCGQRAQSRGVRVAHADSDRRPHLPGGCAVLLLALLRHARNPCDRLHSPVRALLDWLHACKLCVIYRCKASP
ncbi:hypothetical protein XAP412_730034 [Xanthomonas phaseoli pv. phaseoli]|uniref:Uncharacterized protein n=1 Tax=Xanthomonas campestris pv. phaseoli TaxID=317013 RepID=A0AB38E4P2_XANCH|nr:hypothetical protein XAP6984_770033 [Xanthomonas phaseoli pv. phaseoli]SON89507.1 hypothetical protein XAP412_730034 [Xanthomonas phaseoli pv. phaseoli]SON92213.1 hypothetical protein XAP7430_730034 [Xanthomonas phaseoli pv. phaseoli]SOO29067.1 hypothetical protein XAP6164_3020051 [Xanthomonas phaseoli pv. phaseoli]